ncbi:MAG: 50S ribosomal protein L18 [candidate division SR1 bacterium]|nr:MAG: 50S ribosomal protein L18 [candidate division SR1 bacterium]
MSYLKNKLQDKIRKYLRRKNRVNAKIKAQQAQYRLLVDRSNLYVTAQVLDLAGNVVASCSDKGLAGTTKTERAAAAGEAFAATLKQKGVEKIAFDRNGYLYHGRIKAFADGVRKGGIQF